MKYKKDFILGLLIGLIIIVLEDKILGGSGFWGAYFLSKNLHFDSIFVFYSLPILDVFAVSIFYFLVCLVIQRNLRDALKKFLFFAIGNYIFYAILLTAFFLFARPDFL